MPWREIFLALLPLIVDWIKGSVSRNQDKKVRHKTNARIIRAAIRTRDPGRINAALNERLLNS